jgi:protein-disulfide isomerase
MRTLPLRLMLAALMSLSLAACGKSGSGVATNDDMSMGNPQAKVTVIEYASAACPHCARFNNEVFPAFKTKYIDTGRINYVFREFLTEPVQVAAAGFLTARCGGKDKYFSILDAIYRGQEAMYQSGDFKGGLQRIAESAGISDAKFNACISDPAAITALQNRVQGYVDKDHIDSTPTFVVNGTQLVGEQSLASLDKAIATAQAAAK